MSAKLLRSPATWIGVSVLVFSSVLSTRAAGVQSGVNSVPANASRTMSSCAACHSGSAPSAARTNGPAVTLTVGARVLTAGQTTSVSTAAVGGVAGTTGGFLCEATAGTFLAGTGSRINGVGLSITHSNATRRSWSFSFTAPNAPGPIELTSAVMSSNGSGTGSDQFSFSGFDRNATTGTPVRLYVLPTGVTNFGVGCADGYNNVPVLGASSVPSVGNGAFAFQMVGAAPSTLAFLLAGFNPGGFTGLNLGALFGITGCTGYVASPLSTSTTFTSAGDVVRAEGACLFGFPLPNSPSIAGFQLDLQAACIDNSVPTRAAPVTFTNGLHMIVQ